MAESSSLKESKSGNSKDPCLVYLRCVLLSLVLSAVLPFLCVVTSQIAGGFGATPSFLVLIAMCVGFPCIVGLLSMRVFLRLQTILDQLSGKQECYLASVSPRMLDLFVIVSAGLSLFVEMIIIRWQGTVFEFFSLYKNVSLIACFAGLGVGYSLAGRKTISLVCTNLMIFVQVFTLLVLKYGLAWRAAVFSTNPVREQMSMGVGATEGWVSFTAVYGFLAAVFLLTALACIPLGQFCGRLMRGLPPLRAYGCNLAGSLIGVLSSFVLSFFWTPPVVWFALAFACILVFQCYDKRVALPAAFLVVATIVVLAWPVSAGWEKIYSPYQLVERGPSQEGFRPGLTTLRVSGNYYQRILDLSSARQAESDICRKHALYYEFPYKLIDRLPDKVAVLGSGTGNDVAAALRCGARSVDAVEIDPAILLMGNMYHPEKPYQDARVVCRNTDARTYIRNSRTRYDLIVYGLLDSHTLLSHGSSVRLDSFVYTVEGLRESKAKLTDDGILALSFCAVRSAFAKKIFEMIREAFDGRPPLCFETDYDGGVMFVQGKTSTPVLALTLGESGLKDISAELDRSSSQISLSTDDWPFFYMASRIFPVTYVLLLSLVAAISVLLVSRFSATVISRSGLVFFLMGAGFMLIETKGITELGLAFGNTWQVIGVMICGVLVVSFLANAFVIMSGVRGSGIPFVLLIVSLVAGLLLKNMACGSPIVDRVVALVILVLPLLFSGVVFSCLIAATDDVPVALSSNLLGAVVGGLLEYNSMYFGYSSLYIIAIAIYLAAFVFVLAADLRGRARSVKA